MGMIAALIFIGVFTLIAVPIAVSSLSNSPSRQATARLDSAIKGESVEIREQNLNLRKDESVSSIPWLNQRLKTLEVVPHLRQVLNQADLNWSAGRLLAMCLALFVIPCYAAYQYADSYLIAFGIGLLLGLAPLGYVFFKRSRRFGQFEEHLPEALDLMVSGLRAGHSLVAAMALVARECPDPVGTEFKICFEEQNYGLEMNAALDNLTNRVPLQDVKITCSAITIQKESGGNLAEVLDKTAYVIRERFRLKRQIKVHTAQGRLTGWILTLLPVGLGIAMYFMDPGFMSTLWHRKIGIYMMEGAAGLIILGGLTIQKIVNIDV
jgi:tight adherence protein B